MGSDPDMTHDYLRKIYDSVDDCRGRPILGIFYKEELMKCPYCGSYSLFSSVVDSLIVCRGKGCHRIWQLACPRTDVDVAKIYRDQVPLGRVDDRASTAPAQPRA